MNHSNFVFRKHLGKSIAIEREKPGKEVDPSNRLKCLQKFTSTMYACCVFLLTHRNLGKWIKYEKIHACNTLYISPESHQKLGYYVTLHLRLNYFDDISY